MSGGQLGSSYCPVLASSNVPDSPGLKPCRGRVGAHTPSCPKLPHHRWERGRRRRRPPEPDRCLFLPSAHDPYVVCNAPTTCWKPQEQPHQGKFHGRGKRPGPAARCTFSLWCGGGMYCHEPQKGGASFQRGRSLLQPAKLQTGLPSSSPDGQRKAKRLYPFLPK